jgi:hypothetical protein
MDTRYWGPSGWRLLHLIAASPSTTKSKTFWKMLPYVLPCKFCRASLSIYYKEYPIPSNAKDFPEWLYRIHNCVSKKLRDQGQSIQPDPPLQEVLAHYASHLEKGCTKTVFPGWEFLFSIADNHPDSSPSKPMPDTPTTHPKSLAERNQYNLLTAEERKQVLRKFWSSLPSVLPFEEWRISWKAHAGPIGKSIYNRRSAMAWLWAIRCGLETDLEQLGTNTFHGLCKEVSNYRSGCSTSKRAKTCRSLKKGLRKTRRNNQR